MAKEKRITVKIPGEIVKKIEAEAKAEERSVSAQIRVILRKHYDKK